MVPWVSSFLCLLLPNSRPVVLSEPPSLGTGTVRWPMKRSTNTLEFHTWYYVIMMHHVCIREVMVCIATPLTCHFTHLNSHLSTARTADKELNSSIEVWIQGIFLDRGNCLRPTALHNAVWVSTYAVDKHNLLQTHILHIHVINYPWVMAKARLPYRNCISIGGLQLLSIIHSIFWTHFGESFSVILTHLLQPCLA